MKRSLPPALVGWKAFFVGNVPVVYPATYASPFESTPTPYAASSDVPPRNVEKSRPDPLAFNLITNTSRPPAFSAWIAPTRGKLTEFDPVAPVTQALPFASAAIPRPCSLFSPPRYVEYTSEGLPVRKGLIFAANASCTFSYR